MTITQEQATWFAQTFAQLADNVERAVLGKRHVVELVLAAMLSDGHVLLEDVPGTGKTSLARAMAQSVQGTNTRIQFTPDLLPGDITGITVYDQADRQVRVPLGSRLRQHRPRRRDQPGEPQDAVRPAGGHGGGPGDGRRRLAAGRRPLPRARDAEPRGAGRHLPAARGAARPLHDAHVARLPRPRVDGPHPRRRSRRHRRTRRRHHPAGARRHGRPRARRLHRRARAGLHRPARGRHPLGRRGAPGRQHPRRPRAHARLAHPRRLARPHLLDPRRRQGARRGGALAPPDPAPRGRVRRRHAGGRGRTGAAGCRAAHAVARPDESHRDPDQSHDRRNGRRERDDRAHGRDRRGRSPARARRGVGDRVAAQGRRGHGGRSGVERAHGAARRRASSPRAATVGLTMGIVFGWVEWMVAGAVAAVLLVLAMPVPLRRRAPTTSTSGSRTSGSSRGRA